MKQITNKEYEEWQKYKVEKAKGHVLLPDTVRFICEHNLPIIMPVGQCDAGVQITDDVIADDMNPGSHTPDKNVFHLNRPFFFVFQISLPMRSVMILIVCLLIVFNCIILQKRRAVKMDIVKIFGDNLKKYRNSLGLSQEAFAEKCGLHRTYISAIECYRRSIALENVQRIADALGVETYKLFIPPDEQK